MFNKIKKRFGQLKKSDFSYEIKGKKSTIIITLPYSHKLPVYQQQFKLYDKKLIEIVTIVEKHVGGSCMDIGANVGDTAAAIRASSDISLICIEGDLDFFQYLKKNTSTFSNVMLLNAFVGDQSKEVSAKLIKGNGTGKIISDKAEGNKMEFLSLKEISFKLNLDVAQLSLIKIDTDGYDFDIILGNFEFIKQVNAALFFEYEINSKDSWEKSLNCIEKLSHINYKFIVYDNFGNFIYSVENDFINRFKQLNTYIKSSLENGGGIFYADVFATQNAELFAEILKIETNTNNK